MAERVLVVDDDETIRRTLRINLRARGYEVEVVASGRDALSTVEDAPPDLVILDLGLPDLDGVEVLRRLRRTSRRAGGRALGPAAVRRQGRGARRGRRRLRHQAVRHGRADGAGALGPAPWGRRRRGPRGRRPGRHRGLRHRLQHPLGHPAGEPVHLTPTEWRLLGELARHRGRVVTQADLLQAVWGPGYGRESNYLRVYGDQLRRKLEGDPSRPRHILTEPGIGYRLVE